MKVPALFFLAAVSVAAFAQGPANERREFRPAPFDRYIERRVNELSSAAWLDEITPANWPEKQATMRRQLQNMLGLDPWPTRGDLHPVITGTVQGDGYIVEKLHFQSLPGLYVTANLYRPAEVKEPLPAILYVCGHANVVENGVSLGIKTGYQHHGIWFARHGYVCIVLDTIQLGEIRGEHHGTYKFGRWWWAARGYTPAGVEAWNGIRALDYLETRPEVDRTRFGITGRSGGGAYSWWIAGLDDRIKVAVPVAGITTLKNHVLDGAIEGHCDCMFMVNTERWDFDRVAALVAPRPLLISNSDKDDIFPLDGVLQIYDRTRALYRKLGKEANIGIHLSEGPHKDTQPLNIGAFEWMNRFLKGADRMDLIDEPARKLHPPRDLKVFAELPADEKVTTVDEFFVPTFSAPPVPSSAEEWAKWRDKTMQALRRDCFRAWPETANATATKKSESIAEGLRLTTYEFMSEQPFVQTLWVLHRDGVKPEDLEFVVLAVLDDAMWNEFRQLAAAVFPAQFPGVTPAADHEFASEKLLLDPKWATAYVCPRGIGPQGVEKLPERKLTHLRRRLLLLGESLESGRVWDIRQASAALRSVHGFAKTPLGLHAQKMMAANALYASLFIPAVARLLLDKPPTSQRDGPIYLNVLRHLDLPQAVALAAERSPLVLHTKDAAPWKYTQDVARALQWSEDRVQLRALADRAEPEAR
jgi:dienelactone hydrolase